MAHRLKQVQERHDTGVARIALAKTGFGYSVQADLPGHSMPETLNGFRPDVVVRDSLSRIIEIVEVETRDGDDEEKHLAFRAWANANRARFGVVLV